ncbi:KRAB-A domain-containing protein 2-like [Leptopilina heterotoma]|uniref:KRAB-A domain-containing protein 2-like n=1 Tax=Leptopilina heterotoma TaxID=63436 RepID=UPI001CA972D9|nr:KRAB-A domain-containing protein 2-like [Leptopilina heterotoma]
MKRSDPSQPTIFMVAIEDYYDKLSEAHVRTGHGGRDKMMFYSKDKWKISKTACQMFVSFCKTCDRIRAAPKTGVVIKPIVSDGFNMRGQVDLIDLQSCPDGDYKWLLNYQDHATKFLHLRPLKSKHPINILQSDNGREFVAAVIHELVSLWPNTRIVHGRPRHPQSQGSVERANADVENMLRAWMLDHNSTNWSEGCYEVQWQKNTSLHRVIKRTPYEAVLGPIRCGLQTTSLPDEILNTLHTEEQLTNTINEYNSNLQLKSVYETEPTISEACREVAVEASSSEESAVNAIQNSNRANCSICQMHIDDDFGKPSTSDEQNLVCSLCARGKRLKEVQNDCFKRQIIAAEKMVTFSEATFPALNIGDSISLAVPTVDRGPLDFSNILGVITDLKNNVYQISTKHGIIKGWFPRTDIQRVETTVLLVNDVPTGEYLSLREAASLQSLSGGQGYKKCNCKVSEQQCRTRRCACFKSNILCNSRCHMSSSCCNK